jgi:hypothetical protein
MILILAMRGCIKDFPLIENSHINSHRSEKFIIINSSPVLFSTLKNIEKCRGKKSQHSHSLPF